jgi:acyl-CoA thioester hydrolase
MDIRIRVRYPEADPMGKLHHSRYWVYFEMGRTELLRSAGLRYRDLEEKGMFLVVARCSAAYRAPARVDDELTLTTRLARLGTVKIEHEYELRREDGTLVATAQTTLACVDRDGSIQPVPDVLRS